MALRICILETDHIRPELVEQYHGYGRMFKQLFAQQPVAAEFEVFNVIQGQYPDDTQRYDAYLITGSKYDSFGSEPWIQTLREYVLARYAAGDKLLGICFGHQLLALLLGGKTERASQGWGVGVQHYAVHAQEPWMQPRTEQLSMLIIHQDQVTQAPANATILASNSFCPIAAYCIGDQVLCWQGHPELVADYSRSILEIRREHWGEQVYRQALDSLEQAHQGAIVAEWMMRFVAQGQAQAAQA
ncbi:Amidotransferase [Pseudomonas sp. 8AS]|uniref:amidotransferase n=1 Tax=Pseudomonas sp. 8AS TaxID=2653163 RepID=UPI0012F45959|nr:amidotransferase [Pseudomonas sp. 8AS]VXA97487.1 Amidotransferase [Pseudomonas sp. 8AS]